MKPLSDRIVVRLPKIGEQTTDSGLVLIKTEKEKPVFGEVIAIGPGRTENGVAIPIDVAVGDTVYFSKFSGITMELDGEEVLVITERDVLGKQ